jgi:hypothetical protein
MDSLKLRKVLPGLLILLFFSLCVVFAMKASEGPWHQTATELWKKQDWYRLRALGENLHQVGKQDVEAFYVALVASQQLQDNNSVHFFAEQISDTRVLNWKIETLIAKVYRPDSLLKSLKLFRTRIVYALAAVLMLTVMLSYRRKEPFQYSPAVLAITGIAVLLL